MKFKVGDRVEYITDRPTDEHPMSGDLGTVIFNDDGYTVHVKFDFQREYDITRWCVSLKHIRLVEESLPYTRSDKKLNDKISELMDDFDKLLKKAKRYGLDIRLYDKSESLVLYFNDDYPDTLLVDKYLSSKKKGEKE